MKIALSPLFSTFQFIAIPVLCTQRRGGGGIGISREIFRHRCHFQCSYCNVHLCITTDCNCFYQYHSNVEYWCCYMYAETSCRNFVGHNFMFGKSFVRDYSGIPLDTVNLVREKQNVPGFLTSELNVFVHNVTTS